MRLFDYSSLPIIIGSDGTNYSPAMIELFLSNIENFTLMGLKKNSIRLKKITIITLLLPKITYDNIHANVL